MKTYAMLKRKSTVARLDPRIKAAVDQVIREDRATLNEILQTILSMGGHVSKSAVQRYVYAARIKMERFREAQEVAAVWVKEMEEKAGDVGRLNADLLRTLVFQQLSQLGHEDNAGFTVDASDAAAWSSTIRNLASAEKTNTDRELRVRREVVAKAAGKVEALEREAAKGNGALTPDALKRVRQEIYGIIS